MLAFIATDAAVSQAALQRMLAAAAAESFNAITVDGDTSTNDACVLLATGRAGVAISEHSGECDPFATLLREVCIELAQAIIRDGEGATKFITVAVEGGVNEAECRQVAYTIAHSPLIKTAFFASFAADQDRLLRLRSQLGANSGGGGPGRLVGFEPGAGCDPS